MSHGNGQAHTQTQAHVDKVLEKGGPFTDEYFQAGKDVGVVRLNNFN